MKKGTASIRLLGLCLVLGASAGHAKTIQLGTLEPGNYSVTEFVDPGKSFTDHVLFRLDDALQVTTFAKSFDLSIFSFDLLGIDNFAASLDRMEPSGFQTVASLSSNPVSFDDLLTPGQYRLTVGGSVSGFLGGLYRAQVAAVPEADVWIMLLVGFAVVLYQLRRKQRLLEQQPVAA